MNSLLLTIVVFYSCYATAAAGNRLTPNDKYILSSVFIGTQYLKAEREDIVIEYFKTMTPAKVKKEDFKVDSDFTTIHEGSLNEAYLTCHKTKYHKKGQKINNYILLPRFPDKDMWTKLNNLAKMCKSRKDLKFEKLVVAYTGMAKKPTIRKNLIVTPVPVCNNYVKNLSDKNIYKVFVNKFKKSVIKLYKGHQFSVFYYGNNIVKAKPKKNLFNNGRYYERGNDWIAVYSKNKVRAEAAIVAHMNCKDVRNKDVYLYTKLSPCVHCTSMILKFARYCHKKYKRFFIFYENPWIDCLESSDNIKKRMKAFRISLFQISI